MDYQTVNLIVWESKINRSFVKVYQLSSSQPLKIGTHWNLIIQTTTTIKKIDNRLIFDTWQLLRSRTAWAKSWKDILFLALFEGATKPKFTAYYGDATAPCVHLDARSMQPFDKIFDEW